MTEMNNTPRGRKSLFAPAIWQAEIDLNPFASLYAVICCIPQPLNKCIRKCFHPFRLRARIVTLADLSASPSLSKLRAKTPIPCKLEIDLKIVVFLGLFLFSFFPAHCMLTCLYRSLCRYASNLWF